MGIPLHSDAVLGNAMLLLEQALCPAWLQKGIRQFSPRIVE
jgi:hypothetical protein